MAARGPSWPPCGASPRGKKSDPTTQPVPGVYLRLVRFGQWYPIGDAEAAAPAVAGVLQARAEGPLAYPHGQSAMVLYAHSLPEETLHDLVAARGREEIARAIAA